MATATWRTPTIHPNSQGHGTKRRATDELENAQRLAKRFHFLNIDNGGKLWAQPHSQHSEQQLQRRKEAHPQSTYDSNDTEHMQIEDTKERVYINDLDDELANISDSEDEKHMVFLPDIERRLNKVPKSVLASDRPESMRHREMVLYSIPKALSVPEEKDSVRMAIMEARARAREQARITASPDAILRDDSDQDDVDMMAERPDAKDEDEDAMDLG